MHWGHQEKLLFWCRHPRRHLRLRVGESGSRGDDDRPAEGPALETCFANAGRGFVRL